MWIFNNNALFCGFAGFAGFFIAVKFSDSRGLAMLVAILCAMLFDVFLRFTNDETETPSINPEAGGHIWFAPIWVVGIILLILLGLSHYRVI
ncbi:hypothetical protein [Gimesia fumaroli]|uniref:Transmembrane protein n=1 Tax=Gimesia fumaroli TaxID=2527976 RepID=A0A518IFC5_9PLAN|nr:hypothetical protein [Gimesia fumaroli]QDV51787.1 hypothetical protein Enr17x_38450 [Gimesia fumaroli]